MAIAAISNNKTTSPFSSIPPESLSLVLSYLPQSDLIRATTLNHWINRVVVLEVCEPWKVIDFTQQLMNKEGLFSQEEKTLLETLNTQITQQLPPVLSVNPVASNRSPSATQETDSSGCFSIYRIPRLMNDLQKKLIEKIAILNTDTIQTISQELPPPGFMKNFYILARINIASRPINGVTPRPIEQSELLLAMVRNLGKTKENLWEGVFIARHMQAPRIKEETFDSILIPRMLDFGYFTIAKDLINNELTSDRQCRNLYYLVKKHLDKSNVQGAITTAGLISSSFHTVNALVKIVQFLVGKKDFQQARKTVLLIPECAREFDEHNRTFCYNRTQEYGRIMRACAESKNIDELQKTVQALFNTDHLTDEVNRMCKDQWEQANPNERILLNSHGQYIRFVKKKPQLERV